MSFKVHDGYLTSGEDKLSFSTFKELTGSNVDLSKRIGKEIVITRQNGHVYVHDTEFIVGEVYKYIKGSYICKHVSETGIALLAYQGRKILAITSTEPLAYKIVP